MPAGHADGQSGVQRPRAGDDARANGAGDRDGNMIARADVADGRDTGLHCGARMSDRLDRSHRRIVLFE